MELTRHLLLQPALPQLSDQVGLSRSTTIDVRKYHGVPLYHHLHYACVAVLKGIHTVHILIDHNTYGPGDTGKVTGGLNTVQYLWGEVPYLFFGGLHIATAKDIRMLNLGNCRF